MTFEDADFILGEAHKGKKFSTKTVEEVKTFFGLVITEPICWKCQHSFSCWMRRVYNNYCGVITDCKQFEEKEKC